MSGLDARLRAAHATGDGKALAVLYAQAAERTAEETACAFYLTHALVHALEAGDALAAPFRARLAEMGRI